MNPTKRRVNIELLLGISATFLSLAALVVSIFQTKIAREQQRASVWPHLQADVQVTNDAFNWAIVNNGVGPAIIKSVRMTYRSKPYHNARALLSEQIAQLALRSDESFETFYGAVSPGDVIKSDGELRLGQTAGNERIAQAMTQLIQDPSFRVTIVYSDVYANCWQLDGNKVTPLGNCPD